MDQLWDLLRDNESVPGRLVTSVAIIVAAVVVSSLSGRLLARRAEDAYGRYYARKFTRYVVAVVAIVALAIAWQAFAGRLGVVLGLLTAGVAFAMQEVIGAWAGWFNIVVGRIFRVGDRIQMGGVRGDVIDITPLRTNLLEIGSAVDRDQTWVAGRQVTGRIVAISNKMTFTEPVFNFSGAFEFIWEELSLPIPHDADWDQARQIMLAEATAVSARDDARQAIMAMTRHYPLPSTEVEPRVYLRATDDYVVLAARFVVPVRTARSVEDELTTRVLERLEAAGIPIASTTQDVTIRRDESG